MTVVKFGFFLKVSGRSTITEVVNIWESKLIPQENEWDMAMLDMIERRFVLMLKESRDIKNRCSWDEDT